nr:MAG TPA: hypothetical protein [Caudoviricetes sp.]
MTNIEILTHQALQSIDCKMCNQNEINWEQRRYEIAKDLYIQTCQQAKLEGDNTAADVFRSAAWLSRVAADYLIEVLKK